MKIYICLSVFSEFSQKRHTSPCFYCNGILSSNDSQTWYGANTAFARGFCFSCTVNHLGVSALSKHMENSYFIRFICFAYENLSPTSWWKLSAQTIGACIFLSTSKDNNLAAELMLECLTNTWYMKRTMPESAERGRHLKHMQIWQHIRILFGVSGGKWGIEREAFPGGQRKRGWFLLWNHWNVGAYRHSGNVEDLRIPKGNVFFRRKRGVAHGRFKGIVCWCAAQSYQRNNRYIKPY